MNHSQIISLLRKCCPPGGLSLNGGSSHHTKLRTCVENKTDFCVTQLSITYFEFQYPLFVCFYNMSERELE